MQSNLDKYILTYGNIEGGFKICNFNNKQTVYNDETFVTPFRGNNEEQKINWNMNKLTINKKDLEQITMKLKNNLSKASLKAKKHSSSITDRNYKDQNYFLKNLSNIDKGFYSAKPEIGQKSPKSLLLNKRSPTRLNTPSSSHLSSKSQKNKIAEYEFDFLNTPTKKKKFNNYTNNCFTQSDCDPFTKEMPTEFCGVLKPAFVESLVPPLSQRSDSFLRFTPFNSKNRDFDVLRLTKKSSENDKINNPALDQDKSADLLMYLVASPPSARYDVSPSQKLSFTLSQCSTNRSLKSPFSDLLISPRTFSSQNDFPFFKDPSNTSKFPNSPFTPRLSSSLFPMTPQNILPSIKNFSFNKQSSTCLTLTPCGFDMSRYINLFTPSPNNVSVNKVVLKTPDFITNSTQYSGFFNDDSKIGEETHLI